LRCTYKSARVRGNAGERCMPVPDVSRILHSPRSLWCEAPVNRVGLLVDGDDYYRAF
jgi:hypothetical protein